MGNGVSMTRRDGLPRYAERFAAAGFAALTFDFRHLGDSGGEPRQLVDFKRQRTDFAAAVAFARTIDGIDADRVAVWGFSLGGGIAVYVAAGDDRLAAAITLCPGADGLAFTLAAHQRASDCRRRARPA
jgi:dienelactone hydrolase